ncbi:MAG TPA: hypothetical protein ENI15_08940 [Spirochaetes bacterium]|nr:hypothetical protein [Spirochaetota bacterium]
MAEAKKSKQGENYQNMCGFNFSEGNVEEMMERMKDCCPDEKERGDCCSMTSETMGSESSSPDRKKKTESRQ